MKKGMKGFLVIAIGLLIAVILPLDSFHINVNEVQRYLNTHGSKAEILFLLFWLIRLPIFLPGVLLMILGGVCFEPWKAVILSMTGMVLSQCLIYFIAKLFPIQKITNFISKKYPGSKELLEAHQYKFLAIGILCPVAPSDIICYLSASAGIRFRQYVATILLANLPLIGLYSFMGESFEQSPIILGLYGVLIVLIFVFSLQIWNHIKANGISRAEVRER